MKIKESRRCVAARRASCAREDGEAATKEPSFRPIIDACVDNAFGKRGPAKLGSEKPVSGPEARRKGLISGTLPNLLHLLQAIHPECGWWVALEIHHQEPVLAVALYSSEPIRVARQTCTKAKIACELIDRVTGQGPDLLEQANTSRQLPLSILELQNFSFSLETRRRLVSMRCVAAWLTFPLSTISEHQGSEGGQGREAPAALVALRAILDGPR